MILIVIRFDRDRPQYSNRSKVDRPTTRYYLFSAFSNIKLNEE